mgnify:CR=1 FL=1
MWREAKLVAGRKSWLGVPRLLWRNIKAQRQSPHSPTANVYDLHALAALRLMVAGAL